MTLRAFAMNLKGILPCLSPTACIIINKNIADIKVTLLSPAYWLAEPKLVMAYGKMGLSLN